jgi:hypothetical protein
MTTELDLVGTHEIAVRCGVSRSAVSNWKIRYGDFPEALVVLATGEIYHWSDVMRWAKRNGKYFEPTYEI